MPDLPDKENYPGEFSYHFIGNLGLDLDTAIRADTSKQNYSIFPRYWYIDATFCCQRCKERFIFTAQEQKFWYENLRFYVDSKASRCPRCRGEVRVLKRLRQSYDRDIQTVLRSDNLDTKKEMVSIIDQLNAMGAIVHDKMLNNRDILEDQLLRLQEK